jgi:hypothetical protein
VIPDSIDPRSKGSYNKERKYITLVMLQFVGAYGRVEIELCLIKKIIKHPVEIIIYACTFMSHWAGLFHTDFAGGIAEGVKVMLALAHKILAHRREVLV